MNDVWIRFYRIMRLVSSVGRTVRALQVIWGKRARPFLLALFFVLCYTDSIPDGDTVGTNTRFCHYNKEISFLLSTAAEHPVSDGPAASRTATSNSEKSAPGIGQIHSEQQNERMLLIITFS